MRSPDAERYDPPLLKRRCQIAERTALGDVLARLSETAEERPLLERALARGGLHLNGHPVDPTDPPGFVPAGSWVVAWAFVDEPELVPIGPQHILIDRDDVVAVDKPPWITMQRSRASDHGHLEAQLRELLHAPMLRAVHRLDRQTSGVALFARTREAAAHLQTALERRAVEKVYRALVSPRPTESSDRVSGRIVRVDGQGRFRFALAADGAPEGRPSETRLRWLGPPDDADRALVEALPVTGRTHQIRVHLASLGAPIVGDDLYGPAYAPGSPASASRVLLHAFRLVVPWPDGTRMTLEAPLPEELRGPDER